MMVLIKRLLFLFAIALSGAAFLAAGGEMAAHAMNPDLGLLPGAADIWRTLSPEGFSAAEEAFSTAMWWPALSAVLALPGWLIFGAPGLFLLITCHAHDDDDRAEHDTSVFLFDELAKQAREEGFDDDESHLGTSHDFHPADPHYARDDIVDDLIEDAPPHNAGGKSQNDQA